MKRTGILGDSVRDWIVKLRDYDVELLIQYATDEKNLRLAEDDYDSSSQGLTRGPV